MKVEYTVSLRIEKTVYDDEYNIVDHDLNRAYRVFYHGNDENKAKGFFAEAVNPNPHSLEAYEKTLEPTFEMLRQPSR